VINKFWYDPSKQQIARLMLLSDNEIKHWPLVEAFWWDPKENTYGYGPVPMKR
jgi:hypothetical protein